MKKELSLRERLRKYLAARPDSWCSSGELQRLTMAHTDQTARTAVRRLQELAEDGELEHELRHGHSWYKIRTTPTFQEENKARIDFFNNYVPYAKK